MIADSDIKAVFIALRIKNETGKRQSAVEQFVALAYCLKMH
jgi:hypothetical protein